MIISLLLTDNGNAYQNLKSVIDPNDFKIDINKKIVQILYDEFEKGNSNINSILDSIKDEEMLNTITKIMADDYNITDINKAIIDIIKIYEKEKIIEEKKQIIAKLEDENLSQEESKELEAKLSQIIIKLAKIK